MRLYTNKKKICCLGIIGLAIAAVTGCQQLSITKEPFNPSHLPPWNLGEIQQTYKVSSIADSGPGTLREAIHIANKSPGTDKIIFESDSELYKQPQTIFLKSPLPDIEDSLLIDGYIDKMLWQPSGIILDGKNKNVIINIKAGVTVKLKHLTLNNGKSRNGGAIKTSGDLVIEGLTFSSNFASGKGGAIYSGSPRLIIYNSTFFQNRAGQKGGGLYNKSGSLKLTNVTITENSAKQGGGVFNHGVITIFNSIIANSDSGLDCYSVGTITEGLKNIIESNIGCGTPFSSDDPDLKKPGYFNGPVLTIPPGPRSMAVNFGDNETAVDEHRKQLVWDQRGNGDPRYAVGVTDIGAFEIQALNIIEVDTLEDADYRWCLVYGNDCSFRGALLLANNDWRFPTITFSPKVFKGGETLEIIGPLPEINSDLTIDATGMEPLTLSINPTSSFNCSDTSIPKLVNIQLICRQ